MFTYFPAGYENGIDDLYGRLVNLYLEILEKHRSQLTSDPTPNTHNTSVPNYVPKTNNSGNDDIDKLDSSEIIIPDEKSSDSEVMKLKQELHELDLNTDNKCNTIDNQKSKEKEQMILCNHRNCPLNALNSTEVENDSLIWNEMLSKQNDAPDSSVCPCHPNTWTVN
jgi:hypothetical protein